jgi:hypothetical protein
VAQATVDFLRHFCAPNQVELRVADGRRVGPPISLDLTEPPVTEGYAALVAAFARLQAHTHVYFDLPDELTEKDAQELEVGDRLTRGETVTISWNEQTGRMSPRDLAAAAEAEGVDLLGGEPFQHWLVAEVTLELCGKALPLGVCTYHLASTRIANLEEVQAAADMAPDDDVAIRLVFGRTDQGTIQLGTPLGFPAPTDEPR